MSRLQRALLDAPSASLRVRQRRRGAGNKSGIMAMNALKEFQSMAERRTSFGLPDLLASGHGDLLGPGRAQLPLPPLLMFERIELISDTGGANGRGQVVATLKVAGNPSLDWVFSCHFRGDPVMPGSLGLEALWQLTGFYLGWLGAPGKGRALGVREVKLTGMVTPRTAGIEYVVDIKRVLLRRLKLAIADGVVKADGEVVCAATDLTVGLAAGN